MKLMELTIQGNQETGMFINKYNLLNTTLSEATNASLNVIESLGYDSGVPSSPVATSVLQRYLQLTTSNFEINQIYCRDVYNVNDFAQVNMSGAGWQGTRSGTLSPAFMVAKLKSSRTRQDIGAGFKALPIMLGTDAASGRGTLTPAYVTLMQALCTALGDGTSPFVGITQAFFGWAIVGKEEYTTPKGKKAYRYYPDPVDQAAHIATPVSWFPVERATTQNSRKMGRGR